MNTTTELRKAEAAYERASARAEVVRQERNKAIRKAVASGTSQAEVARITGLGRARIGQILNTKGAK